jgi:hypothetical protein
MLAPSMMCIRGDFACSSNTPHMLAIDVPFGLEQPRVSFIRREPGLTQRRNGDSGRA